MTAPAPADPALQQHPTAAGNGFGLTSLILGIVTMVGFAIPVLNYVAVFTGIAGVVFGILALRVKFRPRKAAVAGLILSGLGLVLSIILVIVYTALLAGASKALQGETVPAAGTPSSSASSPAASGKSGSSFKDGVLITSKMKIEITSHRVIAVGQPGNEYGDKPVLAIVYNTTNLTDSAVDPTTAWIFAFKAVQDNDPNAVNTLDLGSTPDTKYLDSQTQSIKQGGTVENAIAYQLDDTTTPVKLTAKDGLVGDDLGSVTYSVN